MKILYFNLNIVLKTVENHELKKNGTYGHSKVDEEKPRGIKNEGKDVMTSLDPR